MWLKFWDSSRFLQLLLLFLFFLLRCYSFYEKNRLLICLSFFRLTKNVEDRRPFAADATISRRHTHKNKNCKQKINTNFIKYSQVFRVNKREESVWLALERQTVVRSTSNVYFLKLIYRIKKGKTRRCDDDENTKSIITKRGTHKRWMLCRCCWFWFRFGCVLYVSSTSLSSLRHFTPQPSQDPKIILVLFNAMTVAGWLTCGRTINWLTRQTERFNSTSVKGEPKRFFGKNFFCFSSFIASPFQTLVPDQPFR